ncbi:MAG: 30S ribosomal protein S17e [Candidatus Nanoarchaeia archaeon]|nr:30S ribosomal protein S17e [Candidatus Nanoarchaeia archaeon]
MGKIKQANIKRFGKIVYKKHFDQISENFDETKKVLNNIADIKSKKLRNVVAGYVSKLKKNNVEM